MTTRRFRKNSRRNTPHRNPDIPAEPLARRYKHNGHSRVDWRVDDIGVIRSCLSVFHDIHRYHATVFARYCAEERCSPRQLRLIEALFIDGLSLREFAEIERVTPQAISARIDALANKAPEFYKWWRRVNASHQRRRKDPEAPKRLRRRKR